MKTANTKYGTVSMLVGVGQVLLFPYYLMHTFAGIESGLFVETLIVLSICIFGFMMAVIGLRKNEKQKNQATLGFVLNLMFFFLWLAFAFESF